MKHKVLILVVAFFCFATISSGIPSSAKSYSPEQLVGLAEANSKQLSNLIYFEKSKKLGLVPTSIIGKTSLSINQASSSVKKLKNTSSKKRLENRLKVVRDTYNRSLFYNSAIKTGEGLKSKTKLLLTSYANNPASNSTEGFYQSVQVELKKLSTAMTKVYGKTTQNAISSTYKVPSERALTETKSAYVLKNEIDLLSTYLKSGKNEAAMNQVDRFNAQLNAIKENHILYDAFAIYYESILRANGVSSDGIPTLILKKIIAQEESVVYLETFDKNNEPLAQGSGFVVGKSTILTNFHVAQDSYKIVAYSNEGEEIAIRGVVRYDTDSDLTILATEKDLSIPALKMGNVNLLEKGDPVVTIGSPEGLMNTVSTGIISNLHIFKTDVGDNLNLIQITAPITHGSSGGALFNMYGEVIGVTSSGYDMGNLNFAVAISHATNWINIYGNKSAANLTVIPYSSLPASEQDETETPQTDPVDPGTITQKEPVSTDKMILDYNLREVIMHPTKPILYGLTQGKDLVEINLETKQARKMTFALPPERLFFANNELYITLLKVQHSSYLNVENQKGAFAIVNADSFSLADIVDIPMDPFDIVADSHYIYISSGSGQWTNLKVFSRDTLLETANVNGIRQASYLEIGPEEGKIYAIDTDTSPRDVETYQFADGKLVSSYDSPYHGDYPLAINMVVAPDGQYIFNGSGVVMQTSDTRTEDMKYVTKLYDPFEEIAFNLNNKRVYTSSKKGLTVYDYSTLERIKHYELSHELEFMFVRDNNLIVVYKETAPGTLLPKQVIKKYPLTEQGTLTFES